MSAGTRPGDKWHFDEEFVKINGAPITCGARSTSTATCSTSWCSRAATRWRPSGFLRKGLRSVPRVIVTDRLARYQVAARALLPSVTHRRATCLNNRAENSRQPTRVRERVMKRFASPGQAQRLLFAFGSIREHFRPRRHLISAPEWRTEMTIRVAVWNQIITAAAV